MPVHTLEVYSLCFGCFEYFPHRTTRRKMARDLRADWAAYVCVSCGPNRTFLLVPRQGTYREASHFQERDGLFYYTHLFFGVSEEEMRILEAVYERKFEEMLE